ncbi:MAG: AbrB/MazE/SpoVT family DNA-binding domain-containing protein [Candidatus Brockarchaeota archaeon]|nr:AbrB/MazE/SpoVT family DNA-binding domain-containing protein [Candidatus Brockarchaeota archaeon]MBO3808435.1 AbrB/MazE/SpoVT family DNA-binding domain-containing protein [Candidatus Brockarchaeota archaeon]
MVEIKVKTRKWGNSIGIIIPKEVVKREKLKSGQEISILILKNSGILKRTFGSMRDRIKKPTQRIMDELDRELYGQ